MAAERRPGCSRIAAKSPVRAKQRNMVVACVTLAGLWALGTVAQGGGNASAASVALPGLICSDPFGAPRHDEGNHVRGTTLCTGVAGILCCGY